MCAMRRQTLDPRTLSPIGDLYVYDHFMYTLDFRQFIFGKQLITIVDASSVSRDVHL